MKGWAFGGKGVGGAMHEWSLEGEQLAPHSFRACAVRAGKARRGRRAEMHGPSAHCDKLAHTVSGAGPAIGARVLLVQRCFRSSSSRSSKQ